MNTIRIGIKNLSLPCIIGCLNEEREEMQTLFVDVSIENVKVSSDTLDATVDYRMIVSLLRKVAENGRFFLIESLAQEFSEELLKTFPSIISVATIIKKPQAIKEAEYTYVHYEVHRGKEQ